jgi:hypothetical protein
LRVKGSLLPNVSLLSDTVIPNRPPSGFDFIESLDVDWTGEREVSNDILWVKSDGNN